MNQQNPHYFPFVKGFLINYWLSEGYFLSLFEDSSYLLDQNLPFEEPKRMGNPVSALLDKHAKPLLNKAAWTDVVHEFFGFDLNRVCYEWGGVFLNFDPPHFRTKFPSSFPITEGEIIDSLMKLDSSVIGHWSSLPYEGEIIEFIPGWVTEKLTVITESDGMPLMGKISIGSAGIISVLTNLKEKNLITWDPEAVQIDFHEATTSVYFYELWEEELPKRLMPSLRKHFVMNANFGKHGEELLFVREFNMIQETETKAYRKLIGDYESGTIKKLEDVKFFHPQILKQKPDAIILNVVSGPGDKFPTIRINFLRWFNQESCKSVKGQKGFLDNLTTHYCTQVNEDGSDDVSNETLMAEIVMTACRVGTEFAFEDRAIPIFIFDYGGTLLGKEWSMRSVTMNTTWDEQYENYHKLINKINPSIFAIEDFVFDEKNHHLTGGADSLANLLAAFQGEGSTATFDGLNAWGTLAPRIKQASLDLSHLKRNSEDRLEWFHGQAALEESEFNKDLYGEAYDNSDEIKLDKDESSSEE